MRKNICLSCFREQTTAQISMEFGFGENWILEKENMLVHTAIIDLNASGYNIISIWGSNTNLYGFVIVFDDIGKYSYPFLILLSHKSEIRKVLTHITRH